MEDLKIDIYRGRESVDVLASEWSKLAQTSWWPVFSCPDWYLAWQDTFGHKAEIALITARANGQLIGVLPLCRRRTNIRNLFLKITEPLSGAYPDYHCPIIASGWESRAFPLMIEKIRTVLRWHNTLIWPHIPIIHPAVPVIKEFVRTNRYLTRERIDACPRLYFEKDYSSTEGLWPAKHKNDIRRQRKRLADIGKLRLWIASTKEEMREFLPEFFQIHTYQWQSRGLSVKFNESSRQNYLYNMVERLWNKGLHISALMCGEERISYHFGFISGGWLLWYIPSYRLKYKNLSPSKVHVSFIIEEGIKAGWKGIDFLIGEERYKYAWSSKTLEIVSFTIGGRHFTPSYFWFSYGKQFIQRKSRILYSYLFAIKNKILKIVK